MPRHRALMPDGPYEVRHVQPYQALKTYRCPGCDHEIPPGRGHEVVVPDHDREGRRHWHTSCWHRATTPRPQPARTKTTRTKTPRRPRP